MTDLERIVHDQINEILEASWAECTCDNLPESSVELWMVKGVVPGYTRVTCKNCKREGVLIFRSERWSILTV